jgi:hypothetical protein
MLQNAVKCYTLVKKYQFLTTFLFVYFSRKLDSNIIFSKYYKIQHPVKSLS